MARLVTLFCLLAMTAIADERNSVVGYWASDGSIFEVYEKDGVLFGQIRVLREPLYGEDHPDAGKPKEDRLNPDPALQSQPVVGLHMFSEYAFEDGMWRGKIYDPESGNTYQSRMKVNEDGELEIRGYVGMPMFGRTAKFVSVMNCEPHIVEMLESLPEVEAC